jgi:hypothetical protein
MEKMNNDMVNEAVSTEKARALRYHEAIWEAGMELEKAQLLLGEILEVYSTDDMLDIRAGLKYWDRQLEEGDPRYQIGKHTSAVCYSFHNICRKLDIVSDIIFRLQNNMADTIEVKRR